jgi:hypothetical protein
MFEDNVFLELQTVLAKTLPKKLKFAFGQLYKGYDDYCGEFLRHGGVIQASPSSFNKNNSSPGISFLIEPDST